MDLSGTWAFELDPDDRGIAEAWHVRPLRDALELPGSLQAQGFGPEVSVATEWTGSIFDQSWFTEPRYEPYRQPGNVKAPFWLQPDTHYQGAAWYARTVELPPEWQGQRVTLTLERPHWETRLWFDEREIGQQASLSTQHVYDLGPNSAPGAHRLTLRIDNRLLVDVGPNAHSVSDHTQTKKMDAPIVSHEIGQWCAYPNFAEIDKYTGYLKARNFEIFRDNLAEHGMGDQAHDFLIASGKLQTLCYKEDIESALRTPGFGGFHLLDLHDFPGQGTALVGVLDAFWDEKSYVTAQEYSRFCNRTVPLARLDKRYWRTTEILTADIDIAHFGPHAIDNAHVRWRLNGDTGVAVAEGTLPAIAIPTGGVQRVGTIEVRLRNLTPARKYTLIVSVGSFENDWDVWVFAEQLAVTEPDDILISERLDDAALARLADGGKVLLMPRAEQVATQSQIGFSSVFWNTAWTNGQAPHTLGILCDPAHPAFADFPTESHSNWQWWELIHGAAAMMLDHVPEGLRPLVQPIDTWFENRRLGLLFEAQVNGGKLLVCSMDLQSDLDRRLVARQLRHSLLNYMVGTQFQPRVAVDEAAIRSIML